MDVIASGIEASPWGLTSYGFEPYIGSPPDNNVAALARYWLDYTTSIVAAEEQFTDRCLPVRYEDLVTDPDGQIARIFEFIGADAGPGDRGPLLRPRASAVRPRRLQDLEHQRGQRRLGRPGLDDAGREDTRAAARPRQRAGRRARLHPGRRAVGDRREAGRPAGAAGRRAPGGRRRARPGSRLASRSRAGPAGRPGPAPAALPDWAVAVDERVRAGMARVGEQFGRAHGSRASESVLLFVNAPAWADADAWWRLDLAAGTVSAGLGEAGADADWSLTGSAQAWDRLLAGQANLGVAFRRGDLRYADKGDAGAGSIGADTQSRRPDRSARPRPLGRGQVPQPERAPWP